MPWPISRLAYRKMINRRKLGLPIDESRFQ